MAGSTTSAHRYFGNDADVIPESEGVGSRISANKSNENLGNEDFIQSTSTSNFFAAERSTGGGYNLQRSNAEDNNAEMGRNRTTVGKMEWITVFILFYVNLINYMDRFTLTGVLDEVKIVFNIEKSQQDLLQTVFLISFMFSAPIFGYMGDRYSRRVIIYVGVVLWSVANLVGSFISNSFSWFVVFRAIIVGIGGASFSTIAPTIISDLFLDDVRSKMLGLFYFVIPFGGALGYIFGAQAAKLGGAWYWSLRVTPLFGLIAVLFMYFFMLDPQRGEKEEATTLKPTLWLKDCKYLCKNKSFVLSTLGFTCIIFVTGSLAWWGPAYIYYGFSLQEGGESKTRSDVSFYFGVITMVSWIIGIPLGTVASTKLRTRSLRADPLICAFALLVSTPFIIGGALLAESSKTLCFTLIFLGQVLLNLNWAIVADMLLYVVIPTRRSTAIAFQILLSLALGDPGTPFLIGAIVGWIKSALQINSQNDTVLYSLQFSLFTTIFIQVVGGVFFLITARFIGNDKRDCDEIIIQSSENEGDLEMKSE